MVSIVYLTKNGGHIFKKSLAAVYSQEVDFAYKVIVVDSGSTDGTLAYLDNFPVSLYHIQPAEFNFGSTRDYGFSLAKGKILIVISQDAVPVGDRWLSNLICPFTDESIAVVQGMDILPENGELFYWDRVRLFYHTRDCKKWMAEHNNIGLSFTSCAIRRTVWEENPLGHVEMSEDKVFQMKMREKGHKIVFQREAMTFHSHFYDVKSLAKRCENEGLGWRNVAIHYTIIDMLKDLTNPKILKALALGLLRFDIKHLSEFLFPVIRPIFVFKGNNFTRTYVK